LSLHRIRTLSITLVIALALVIPAQAGKKGGGIVQVDDLRTYLTYLSSDDLEGRNTFTEGLGLAQAYIAEQLRSYGLKPGGDHGLYFERVAVVGVKVTDRSSLTVEVNGQSKTFKNGEGITLPRNVGGKRTLVVDQVEFLGYGLNAPTIHHNDYAGKDVKGKAVVFLGAQGPAGFDGGFRMLGGRASTAIEDEKAAASIGIAFAGRGGRGGATAATGATGVTGATGATGARGGQAAAPAGPPAGAGGRGGPLETPDFTTVQRLDNPIPPQVTAQDEFFEFLFSNADVKYAALKDKAGKREDLPTFTLKGVKLTFNLDADYRIVRTQYTRNVVGILPGSDPKLKDTYVTFGAHLDHVGYAEGEVVQGTNGPTRQGAPGRVSAKAVDDRIWNGADDDGSGSATLLGVAKAFANGPKMKRSLAFIWHTGEERGLYGSRYNADFPAVPIEKTVANLNMDMIGRNDQDKAENANQVFLVGSDRISTELHEIVKDVNSKMRQPLTLDFAMNDPSDPERVYYRSDHYSYASKGIPIIFFTTGLHPDYHANTDSVEKILFDKMARIGQLVYDTGKRVANLDHPPARDNKGPRAGKGTQ
jgi:hypothetical protein